MSRFDRKFFKEFWALAKPYWSSEERGFARALLAVVIALNLGLVYINVEINLWSNDFYNTLQNLDREGFFDQLVKFCVLAGAYIVVAVYQLYLNQMLQIRWRRWLTERYVEAWLADRAYYRLQVFDGGTDNPDQRISEDLQMFVEQTLTLGLGLMNAVVTLGSFVVILWTLSGAFELPLGPLGSISIPGYMVWAAVLYAGVGTWLAHVIGRPLIDLNFNQQRVEANFRYSMVRLRENAEQVALYGGEAREAKGFAERFRRVLDNFRAIMERQKKLTFFTAGYSQLAVIFPVLVVSPRYFAQEIQLGGLMQTASAFGQVQSALSYFVTAYANLASWRAVVDRLITFSGRIASLRGAEGRAEIATGTSEAKRIETRGLTLRLPGGRVLVRDLDLGVRPGERVLVMGPTGSGKSTLFRAFAGIWPFGAGGVLRPKDSRLMILPQRPYIPLGTLREALLYPRGGEGERADDGALGEALRAVGLERLVASLDQGENWGLTLSLGEQQRIALARLLLAKPDWILLDEATSALDEPTETRFYALLRERLPEAAIVSIGHRGTLKALHDRRLELDGQGGWAMA